MKNSDQPAHPAQHKLDYYLGLTKCEYFAGLAMQGILANSHPEVTELDSDEVAKMSTIHADKLLKQLYETNEAR